MLGVSINPLGGKGLGVRPRIKIMPSPKASFIGQKGDKNGVETSNLRFLLSPVPGSPTPTTTTNY